MFRPPQGDPPSSRQGGIPVRNGSFRGGNMVAAVIGAFMVRVALMSVTGN